MTQELNLEFDLVEKFQRGITESDNGPLSRLIMCFFQVQCREFTEGVRSTEVNILSFTITAVAAPMFQTTSFPSTPVVLTLVIAPLCPSYGHTLVIMFWTVNDSDSP